MRLNLQFDFSALLDLNSILQVHHSTVEKMQQREGNDCEYAKRILKARELMELPFKGRELFEKPLFGVFTEEDQSPWIKTSEQPPTKEFENDGKILFVMGGHLYLAPVSDPNAQASEMWMVCPPATRLKLIA